MQNFIKSLACKLVHFFQLSLSLKLHLAGLFSLLALLLFLGLGCLVKTVLLVLLLIQSRLALAVDELVVQAELLPSVGLERYHLFDRQSVADAAAVQPKFVDRLFVHAFRFAHLVVVES